MILYVLVVTDDEGSFLLAEVFSEENKAVRYLAEWCRESWKEEGHEDDLCEVDLETIHKYFDYWEDSNYRLKKREIDEPTGEKYE